MANGYLIVRVSAAGGTIPLEDAIVTVYNADNGESGIIATRFTDASGRTDKIALEAPLRALSESPDNGGVRPYAIYNVDVIKEGYYDSFNLEVPVFDGITSVLPVDMLPLSEYDSENVRPELGLVTDDREPP
ncbi:MAG: hypothetical protein IJ391_04400, partial [Clostridia bacterium]|nr:hypothetical protein [Clostridia bacterium]